MVINSAELVGALGRDCSRHPTLSEGQKESLVRENDVMVMDFRWASFLKPITANINTIGGDHHETEENRSMLPILLASLDDSELMFGETKPPRQQARFQTCLLLSLYPTAASVPVSSRIYPVLPQKDLLTPPLPGRAYASSACK